METSTNNNPLTKAEETYNSLMSWKGLTYVIVAMYIFMAGVNIYKQLKK